MTTEEITTNTVTKTNELSEQKGLDAPLVSGLLLLHDLFQVANIKNEDGMPSAFDKLKFAQ